MSEQPIPVDAAVGVIGAGTMGSGIAWVAAEAGHQVLLYDVREGAVDAAVAAIDTRLQRSIEKGRRSPAERESILERLGTVGELTDFADTGLVIEAIAERLDVKRDLFSLLEDIVDEKTILATNTSSLSVTAVAGGLRHPGRVVGMHFFNPAPVMPLVEIVMGATTTSAIVEAAYATAAAWGKTPVRCTSTPGFIVNRVARPFYSEALRIVAEGTTDPATIDRLVTGSGGFRMGPFALMDLVGLDVNLAVTTSVYEQTLDPRFAPNVRQQALVDAGRLGRKSGHGWFDYAHEREPPAPMPHIAAPLWCRLPPQPRWNGLAGRLETAGVEVVRDAEDGRLEADGVAMVETDGRSAAMVNAGRRDPPTVVFDVVRDWATATAIAIAAPSWTPETTVATAAGGFQAAGLDVHRIGDNPGLVLGRIVAQLVSVAADAATEGVASPDDIDTAMRLGTNYPAGPFEWSELLTAPWVAEFLDNLRSYYGEDRYRTAGALRRSVLEEVTVRRLLS